MTEPTPPSTSYEDALSELEQILEEIEDDALPIDLLAPKVERAAALLEVCRGILQQTETRVAEVIDALRGDGQEPNP